MGSATFYTYANGADLTTAFNAAIQDALYTYGHRDDALQNSPGVLAEIPQLRTAA